MTIYALRRLLPCPIFAVIAIVLALLAASATAPAQTRKRPPAAKSAPTPAAPVKVAEGKYELHKIGGKADRTFEEPWTLYRTHLGYELKEHWLVGAGPSSTEPNVIDVSVDFVPGLHPLNIRIGLSAENSLQCSLELTVFSCKSQGLEASLPMQGIYDFYSPSPWMMGSIARRAQKVPDQITQVQLVRVGGMNEAGPKLFSFKAEVQYVGEDQIEVSGQRFSASIFELKSPHAIPPVMVWISSEGIVLSIQDSTKQEQRMDLVEFKKYGKF